LIFSLASSVFLRVLRFSFLRKKSKFQFDHGCVAGVLSDGSFEEHLDVWMGEKNEKRVLEENI
jgi:hypothetical protein